MKTLLLIALLFVSFGNLLQAQNEIFYPKKGRIVTTDGTVISFKVASETGNLLRYKTRKGIGEIPLENVAGVDIKTGTEAGKYALILGGLGLAFSVPYSIGMSNPPGNGFALMEKEDVPTYIIGTTIFCAGAGALFGLGRKKYTPVYTNPKYGSTAPTWRLDLVANNQQPGLTLRVTF